MFNEKLGTGVNGFPAGCQGLLQLPRAQPVADGTAVLTVVLLLVVAEDSDWFNPVFPACLCAQGGSLTAVLARTSPGKHPLPRVLPENWQGVQTNQHERGLCKPAFPP